MQPSPAHMDALQTSEPSRPPVGPWTVQDSEASYRINEDQVRGLLRHGNSTPLRPYWINKLRVAYSHNRDPLAFADRCPLSLQKRAEKRTFRYRRDVPLGEIALPRPWERGLRCFRSAVRIALHARRD